MEKHLFKIVMVVLIAMFSSCTTLNKTMREPNARVELSKNDFTLSDQVSADAQTTKILGIDFARIFIKKTGTVEGAASVSIASIPVIGNLIVDKTANYSLYELMSKNPGFDVVFYPQYETKTIKPILGIGILTKITTVKTTARLGKLNK
jgi:hypothetical protein